jgi:hypothetical protein
VIVDVNPFVYSRPIAPEDIIDRDQETRELLRNAVGGHFVRLFAPRKYGKTSLLRRALRDGERQEGLIPVLVDLYRVSSIADVTIRFERAYAKQLQGALRTKVESFLQKTGLGLSLGAFGISAKLQLDPRVDPLPALHALLDLPLRLEEGGGYRAFIALDEFQDVGKVLDLDGLIRSHIQYQGEVASYVFAGSEPALMKQLFEDKARPLYGSAVPMRLQRLRNEDIAVYVSERFRAGGRDVGEALNPLVETAGGHPQRAMLLAHHLYERLDPGTTAGIDEWVSAYAAARREAQGEAQVLWDASSALERRVLKALAHRTVALTSREAADRFGLAKSGSTSVAVERLVAEGHLVADGGTRSGWRILDPFLAAWLREDP